MKGNILTLLHSGWSKSIALGFTLAALFSVYSLLAEGVLNVHIVNRILADVGMLLIGYSVAVVSIQYFFHWTSQYIHFRKELGLLGFWLIFTHGVITLALPKFSLVLLTQPENIVGFSFAVISFLILSMMTIISFDTIRQKLGAKRWGQLLGFGFIAYTFGLLHGVIKSYPYWLNWASEMSTLPPIGLPVAILAIALLGIKFAYEFRKQI